MAVLKCKMCGAQLEAREGANFAYCEYCGTQQTVPKIDDELKLPAFIRATELRIACDFDQAAGVFQSIIAQYPEEAEAYWGLVLCKYGIEYVDDPHDGRKVPTCHRTQVKSVLDDADYLKVCQYADHYARWKYEEEAKVIDGLQQRILSISRTEEPYDVFLCYKETDDVTRLRTEDSEKVQELYMALIAKGYKVFFARVTLRGKAGSEYEPYIYAALMSAKVMLVVGSKPEYFDAVWVKNEWLRYLEMMNDARDKLLIPCYYSMRPEQLPKQLQRFQALDMTGFTFWTDLYDNVERVSAKAARQAAAAAPASPSRGSDVTHKELNYDDGVYVGETIGNRHHGYGTRYYNNGDKYEGHWNMGSMHGQGTFTYANGVTWVGEWRNNQPYSGDGFIVYLKNGVPTGEEFDGTLVEGKYQGKGFKLCSNGDSYFGDFVDGKYCGQGKLTQGKNSYEGCFENNRFHGQGTYTYADGSTWVGEWKEGDPWLGNGVIIIMKNGKPTGERYEGALESGHYHGKGVLQYANGNRYEGDFARGMCHGRGVFVRANGDRYEGETADNRFHGQGTFTYADGTSWTGEWKNDSRWNGVGRTYLYTDGKLNGNYYEGPCQNGQRQGNGISVYADGNRYEGEYHNDRFNGKGTFTYANGDTWTGVWKDDARWTGKGVTYFYTDDGELNGNYYKGPYIDGKPNGMGVFYKNNGDRYEGSIENGMCHGRGTYVFKSGEIWNGIWKEDSRWTGKGTVYMFDENGKLNGNRYVGDMLDGKFQGQGAFYWNNGYCTEGEFRDDDIWNGRYVDPKGKVVDKFTNGESQNARTQKRNQIIGSILSSL